MQPENMDPTKNHHPEREREEFTLNDRDGTPQHYIVVTHQPSEALHLTLRQTGQLGIALGALLEGSMGELAEILTESQDLLDIDTAEIATILGAVQWSEVTAKFMELLTANDSPQFMRQMFRHTYRNGKPLHQDLNFNAAYRANYLEFYHALWRIVEVNRFVGFTVTQFRELGETAKELLRSAKSSSSNSTEDSSLGGSSESGSPDETT